MLKSNAYGHGLAALAPVAVAAGADYLGICTNPEAAAVRALGLDVPLLRLRMGLPEELDEGVRGLDVEEQVGTLRAAEYLSALGCRFGRDVRVHLNIDTGMGRSGFFPEEIAVIRRVIGLPRLKRGGRDDALPLGRRRPDWPDRADSRRVRRTLRRARRRSAGRTCCFTRTIAPPRCDSGDRRRAMVRVGAACYGVRTSQEFANPAGLRPVMSVKTRVAQVREIPAGRTIGYGGLFTTQRPSRIASLPVGFGEGYPRSLFNKGIVLIHGQRCPVVGRVSLNITTVDVTDLTEPAEWGDEVVLVGRQGRR